MSSADDQIQKLLQEERQQLEKERQSLEKAGSEQSLTEESGDLADFDRDHPADSATATYDREKDSALLANIEKLILKVDRALEKLADGSYARCDRCEKQIAPERMEAMLSATLCLECQALEDGL